MARAKEGQMKHKGGLNKGEELNRRAARSRSVEQAARLTRTIQEMNQGKARTGGSTRGADVPRN